MYTVSIENTYYDGTFLSYVRVYLHNTRTWIYLAYVVNTR